jgi:hypothetical protein
MMAREQCQHRWKLDYIDGRRAEVFGVYLDFGTAMHEVLELFHCKNPDPAYTIDICVFLFKEKLKYLFGLHVDKFADKDRELIKKFDFFKSGEHIIRHFHECEELRDAQVLFNEYPLYDKIERSDDIDINFKGFIDLVIKTKAKNGDTILYVCDFKTCSWGWTRERMDDRNKHFQILLYKHFICKKFGLDPKLVRTAFVLLKRSPRKGDIPIQFLPISAGPVAVGRALDELNRDITELDDRLKKGTLKKNRNSCKNKFGDTCPYYDTDLCPKE